LALKRRGRWDWGSVAIDRDELELMELALVAYDDSDDEWTI
jgi:hypothetical protein